MLVMPRPVPSALLLPVPRSRLRPASTSSVPGPAIWMSPASPPPKATFRKHEPPRAAENHIVSNDVAAAGDDADVIRADILQIEGNIGDVLTREDLREFRGEKT